MKARMICDFNNEVSMKYTELAINSFKNTDLEIERVQCVTPDTFLHQDFELQFGLNDSDKWKGKDKKISPSEQACFASHFREWKAIAENSQRHLIMEHDAYLREGHEDKFNTMMEYADLITMFNCGIAMECYTMSVGMAQFNWHNFDHNITPSFDGTKWQMSRLVSAGPMAELLTSAKGYYIMNPRIQNGNINPATWLWPDNECNNMVVTAKDVDEYKRYTKGHYKSGGLQNAPVTQVFCPSVTRTIDHEDDNYQMNMDGYENKTIRQMKVVDTL